MKSCLFRCAIIAIVVSGLAVVFFAVQSAQIQGAVKPGSTASSPQQATGRLAIKEKSVVCGLNILRVTAYDSAAPKPDQCSMIFDTIHLNDKRVLSRIVTDRDAAYSFYVDKDRYVMLIDNDGDGFFETILLVVNQGADFAGLVHTKSGELSELDTATREKLAKEFRKFVDAPGESKGSDQRTGSDNSKR